MKGGRSRLFAIFALADRLHMTAAQVRAMTVEEFAGWQAYFRVIKEQK